jgi:probable metal-binding protein
MTQLTQIHAHEALAFIDVNGGEISLTELPQTLAAAFGEHARFNACSAQGMDVNQLTQFFIDRDKIIVRDGRVYLNRANVCSH